MLQIKIPINPEGWDEEKEEFVPPKEQVLSLEHSLVSISKWESKWKKSFFSTKNKTTEEVLDYIRCMTVTSNVDPDVYNHLTTQNIKAVDAYIGDPMTATVFYDDRNVPVNRETITAELLYYWMIAAGIPFECQKWHVNRLITLIRVCQIKSQPQKKMNKQEIMRRNAALNAQRRRKLNSKG